ncbi:hypothetical protein ABTN31_18715, partial [Acinetobacter baumannii]
RPADGPQRVVDWKPDITRDVSHARPGFLSPETLYLQYRRIKSEGGQIVAERFPRSVEAAVATNVDQGKTFGAQCISDQSCSPA